MYKDNLRVNSGFCEPKFPCSCDENYHYSKSGIYKKVYSVMAILCLGNGFTNPDGFNSGMNDAGGGSADNVEENRISPPAKWQRGQLIETSLSRKLSVAKTPLM